MQTTPCVVYTHVEELTYPQYLAGSQGRGYLGNIRETVRACLHIKSEEEDDTAVAMYV